MQLRAFCVLTLNVGVTERAPAMLCHAFSVVISSNLVSIMYRFRDQYHKSWLTPTNTATRCVKPSRYRAVHRAGR